jgi:hypothetical protein
MWALGSVGVSLLAADLFFLFNLVADLWYIFLLKDAKSYGVFDCI